MHAPINSLAGLLLQREGETADRVSLVHLLALPRSGSRMCTAHWRGERTCGVSLLGRFDIGKYSYIKSSLGMGCSRGCSHVAVHRVVSRWERMPLIGHLS